jgi:predicted SAM-dependent methyltransferase
LSRLTDVLTFFFSERTVSLLLFDITRLRARAKRFRTKNVTPASNRLHLGCGRNRVPGWLNVDVRGSDYDVDLAHGRLPWRNDVFDIVVSQHLIEHLEMRTELIPLLKELRRVIKPSGEIWLSCPDIEKVCKSYINHRMTDLLENRKPRWPQYSLGKAPTSHLINDLFHQFGEHKNLFDFALLDWLLTKTGFKDITRLTERDLLERVPDFPVRNDDVQSIYVRALAS